MSVPPLFLKGLFIRKCVVFSGHALLLYDYLITFPLEVQYIWKAPWTPVKAGFLLNRYGNAFGQTFVMLAETGYVSQKSEKFCVFFRLYCTFFMVFSAESIRILVLMRAWAIWRCRYGVAIFSITLYVFYVLVVVATVIYSQIRAKSIPYEYLRLVGVCISPVPSYIWLMWLATLGLDTVVLAMIWYSSWKLFKESRGIYPSPLVRLLVRDAILFYTTSVFNNLFSITCWTIFHDDPRCFLQLAISFPLLSVIGQRLILNLRGFQARPFTTRDISREVDRQMEAMGDRLGANDGRANEQQSDDSKTTGATLDPALELIEIRRT